MPSPFEMGAAIGGNIGGAGHKMVQRSTIDDIMKQAQETGDPTHFNNIMGQILQSVDPENRQAVIGAVQQRQKLMQQEQQRQQAAQYYESQGIDPRRANLDLAMQKELIKQDTAKQKVKTDKQNEKLAGAKAALASIKRQRELLEGGHLGSKMAIRPGTTGAKNLSFFSHQGNMDRAEYSRLGRGLITQATTLNIRNKPEFEAMREGLDDPRLSQEEIEGNILGMERMIQNRIKELGGEIESQQFNTQTIPEEVAKKAWEQSGGDPQKARQILIEQGYGQ